MQITADKESSIGDLQKIISTDLSLTTSVLKMANSPFFGLSRTVTSLQHAISVLGMNEIRNLVLARAMFQTFREVKNQTDFDFSFLWRHSFFCALASKMLAEQFHLPSHDYFVAGLIHDVGKLVFIKELSIDALLQMEINKPGNDEIFTKELQLVDIRHDELGMQLLKKWMFPLNLTQSAGFHHGPHKADGDKTFPMIICLADHLSHLQSADDAQEKKSLMESFLALPYLGLCEEFGLKVSRQWLEDNDASLEELLAEEDQIKALFS